MTSFLKYVKALLRGNCNFRPFSDVSWMGVPFVTSLTAMRAKESNMAAVFVALRLSAVGTVTECEVLWFLLVGRTLLTLRRAFYLEDLLPGCWGDQGSCELVLRRTRYKLNLLSCPRSLFNRTSI